jgi:WD40 repeat protein/serine/threonine protein kinase
MTADQPQPLDEPYASWFAAGEEALATGRAAEAHYPAGTPAELQPQLQRDLAFVQLLRQALHGPGTPAAEPPPGLPWSSLGRFQLRSELGRGSYGIVYLAYDPLLDREVALKVPRAEVAFTPELRERFHREVRAAAGLDHPHLVPVYEAGEAGPVCFLVSAYCPGITLADWLRQRREPVSFADAAGLVALLAEAVQHAHERGVVHRDLKPANILLRGKSEIRNPKSETNPKSEIPKTETPSAPRLGVKDSDFEFVSDFGFRISDFDPKITDFGLAKLLRDDEPGYQTRSGAIVGTVSYMAPEQAAGKVRQVGPAADLYALGAILYELVTGRPPFVGDSELDTLQQVQRDEPVPPSRLRPKTPRDLETIGLKCLQKEPSRRYASAAALAEDLRRYLAGRPIQARPVGALERAARWCRRNPAWCVVIGLAASVLVAATALVIGFGIYQAGVSRSLADLAEDLRQRQEQVERQQVLAERRSAVLFLTEGLHLCEQGKLGPGLLHLAESIATAARLAPADGGDIERAARANLAAWQAENLPLHALFQPRHSLGWCGFCPDGKTILTYTRGIVEAWDTATGRGLGPPLMEVGYTQPDHIWAGAFSPDGRLFLTGDLDGTVQGWDVATGKPVGPVVRLPWHVGCVAFSPNGQVFLSGGYDNTVRQWDVRTGASRGPALSHPSPIEVAIFSPDGRSILTACEDANARLWDAAAGTLLHLLPHQGQVRAVAFSPDGHLVLTGGVDDTAQVWDAATGERRGPPLRHSGAVYAVAFRPDGRTLVTGTSDMTARLWEAATGKPLGKPLLHPVPVANVAFSPDGRLVLTGGGGDPRVHLWQVTAPSGPARILRHESAVRAVALSRDGRTACTGSHDGTVRLWDTATGKPVGPLLQHPERVLGVALSPDGRTVLTGSADRTAQLWDAATGERLGLPLEHPRNVHDVLFSPDGQTLLTAGADGLVRLWEAGRDGRSPSGRLRGPPLDHGSPVEGVAFSPDGQTILTGANDGMARLWDVATGKPLDPPFRHPARVRAVAYSPDGQLILTGSSDKMARLWQVATRRLTGPPLPHEGTVTFVAFSPDGRTLLVGSNDRTARLWDAATANPIGPPLVHDDWVNAVAFARDGRAVLTGSSDNSARLWPMPAPVPGEPERIRLWVQVRTGMELDEAGVVHYLDAPTWHERRRRLLEQGGPLDVAAPQTGP